MKKETMHTNYKNLSWKLGFLWIETVKNLITPTQNNKKIYALASGSSVVNSSCKFTAVTQALVAHAE